VAVPQERLAVRLFAGSQTVTATGTDVDIALSGACAQVVAARFTLRSTTGDSVPVGVRAEVVDAATVRLAGPDCRLVVTTPGGHSTTAVLRRGRSALVSVSDTVPYPLADAALGCQTFPTSPLPPGMSDPAAAVDGDPATSWTPGSTDARMVVDLGSVTDIHGVMTRWRHGPAPAAVIEFSTDGVTYEPAGALTRRGSSAGLDVRGTARYVALALSGGHLGHAGLTALTVVPA
jgi:hypothetical protein